MTKFSYQLYSSRNFPPLSNTLKELAALGYAEVEGYGGLFSDVEQAESLRSELDANDLTMPTAHIGLDMVEADPKTVVGIAKALGVGMVFGPHIGEDQRPSDAAGWRAFGARLAEAAKPLEDAGIRFGWHNHDFEFTHGSAVHPMDWIFEGGPDLAFEFDLAWCIRAGVDHIGFIERHADRLLAAHIKDIAPVGEKADEDGWADVGDGVIDWRATFDALAKTKCQHFVAEHDNPSDGHRFASRSIAFMNSL
ncbi:MAG: sugar phosphate isomerase/epimerase [Silicimonas sp.]|nr:sugar phosphate isomerase/epimerase [Silicimonas sp.]